MVAAVLAPAAAELAKKVAPMTANAARRMLDLARKRYPDAVRQVEELYAEKLGQTLDSAVSEAYPAKRELVGNIVTNLVRAGVRTDAIAELVDIDEQALEALRQHERDFYRDMTKKVDAAQVRPQPRQSLVIEAEMYQLIDKVKKILQVNDRDLALLIDAFSTIRVSDIKQAAAFASAAQIGRAR